MTADPLYVDEDDPARSERACRSQLMAFQPGSPTTSYPLDEDPRAGARAVGCILVALAVEVALVAAVIVWVFHR